jgi:hypothetical protein
MPADPFWPFSLRPLAAALLVCCAGARAFDLTALFQGLDAQGQCAQTITIGTCSCGPVPCAIRVERFVPVAIAETTRSPGDSIVAPLSTGPAVPAGTLSSSISLTDNTAEAHVWTLPDALVYLGSCLGCRAGSAISPSLALDPSPAACGAASSVVQATQSAAAMVVGSVGPKLAYASEFDALNWRTGCRDKTNSGLAAAFGLACAANFDASGDACIGRWGPLRPRQMRDVGPVGPLYSAKTAVRAMSIARDQLGTFAYPVDGAGRLQQVYPSVSDCFGVGELPLPQSGASLAPVRTSRDGRYAWLYWRKVGCCIGYGAAAQCLVPRR